MTMKKRLRHFCSGVFFLVLTVHTALAAMPLPVDQAFHLEPQVKDATHVDLQWDIAPDYHLYSDSIQIAVIAPNSSALANWSLPDGKIAYDTIRGQHMEYYQQLIIPLTLLQGTTADLRLQVKYQGCADAGVCYPSQTKLLQLGATSSEATSHWFTAGADLNQIKHLLAQQSLLGVWLSFFVFGLLLAFTPCVFPMLPILSSIIVGHGHTLTRWRAFYLSCMYVLASALTYACAGVLAGLAGDHLQSALQNSWVLAGFGCLLLLLSLSLFGFYELQLPQKWQHSLDQYNRQQARGSAVGALIMGCISTLIVSPCVSAPLVGALAYIGQTGSPWLGGSALLIMGLGMGVPLVLVGISAGQWLPKAGKWMMQVKAVFGVSLVWLAIEIWSRFLNSSITLALWGVLAMIIAVYLGAFEAAQAGWSRFWKGCGLVLAFYAACLILGAASGASDPWQPLAKVLSIQPAFANAEAPGWQAVHSVAELDGRLAEARAKSQAVLIDFYADWCVSCKKMDQEVFSQASIQQWFQQQSLVLLRIDVSQQGAAQVSLQKRFEVIAPPTLIYIDKAGVEHSLVGEQTTESLLAQLK